MGPEVVHSEGVGKTRIDAEVVRL